MKTRLILTAAAAAVAVLAACTKEDPKEPLIDGAVTIIDGSDSDYRLIFGAEDRSVASQIGTAVFSVTGVSLPRNPSTSAPYDKEILVGSTGRPETAALLAKIGQYGYGIEVYGQKIVLAWTEDRYIVELMDVFRNEILSRPGYCFKERWQVPSGYSKIVKGEAPPKTPTIADYLREGKEVNLAWKHVGDVPPVGNCSVAQGAASDGKYAYFVLRDGDDQNAIILKYTLEPFRLVAKSETFNGGHCNDLTYDDKAARVVLAHGQSEGKILTMIDAATLKVLGNVNIPVGSGAITYNKKRDRFAISQGGSTLYVADHDFKVEKSFSRSDKTGYTAQGMGSDDYYVYFPMSKTDNVLVTYDWDGNFIKTIKLGIEKESESMFCVNERYYVCFYAGSRNGAILYEIFLKEQN